MQQNTFISYQYLKKMKTRFLTIVALAALTACSGNANKNTEGKNDATTQPAENVVEKAVKIWSEDEDVSRVQESMDTTYVPNQVAYYDIDGDGTQELILREYIKEYNSTGFIAAFSLKDGVKKIALSNNNWQTTWFCVYNNGVVETDNGSEDGMEGWCYFFKLKDSDVEATYTRHSWEDEETGEGGVEYSVSTSGSEAKTLTEDEFKTALGVCVGDNASDNTLDINNFKWEDIK